MAQERIGKANMRSSNEIRASSDYSGVEYEGSVATTANPTDLQLVLSSADKAMGSSSFSG